MCDCKCHLLGCRFDPHSRKLNIYFNLYIKFKFSLWFRDKAWHRTRKSTNFHHSIRNTSKNWRKMGNGVSLHQLPSAYPAVYGIHREADFFFFLFIKYSHTNSRKRNENWNIFQSRNRTAGTYFSFLPKRNITYKYRKCYKRILSIYKIYN